MVTNLYLADQKRSSDGACFVESAQGKILSCISRERIIVQNGRVFLPTLVMPHHQALLACRLAQLAIVGRRAISLLIITPLPEIKAGHKQILLFIKIVNKKTIWYPVLGLSHVQSPVILGVPTVVSVLILWRRQDNIQWQNSADQESLSIVSFFQVEN